MPTELTSVTCNHCGAPLQVPDTTRFLTCSYCGTQLEVKRTGSAIYTEVLASIDERTQQIAQDVDEIKRQNEIERLDREWQMRRETLLTRGKDGSTSEPSAALGIVGAVIAAIFGVFWTVTAASAGAPAPMVLFGVVFIVAALIGGIASVGKAASYREAEQSYRQQREMLLHSEQKAE